MDRTVLPSCNVTLNLGFPVWTIATTIVLAVLVLVTVVTVPVVLLRNKARQGKQAA